MLTKLSAPFMTILQRVEELMLLVGQENGHSVVEGLRLSS